MTELALWTALDLAQAIRTKALSPLEVTQYFLDRIDRWNDTVGAFVHVAAETAIATAQAQTEQLAQTTDPHSLPPFFGVPLGVKDLNTVAGMPTRYGVVALPETPGGEDDGVVTKLRQGGFNILGKTSTSQLGSFPYTEPPGFLPTRNPWKLDHTAGGSSGGSGAAIASGFCPVAQGSDGGGSVRGPASCCGLVGLKPSRGRISFAPVGDYQSGIASHGPLARTVLEGAALLDVMAGYILGDPYWLPDPQVSFYQAAQHTPPSLRIAYQDHLAPFPSTSAIQQGVKTAIALCETLGHTVEPDCFDGAGLVDPFTVIWQAGVGASGIPLALLEPVNQWLGEQTVSAGTYLQAVGQMQRISRQIVAFMNHYDALILPVFSHQPPRVGAWADLPPETVLANIIQWVAPCPPFNASGLPAIALPVGWDHQGLPVGIQIIGKPAADALVLALAHQLEQALALPRRLPPGLEP